jgi:hypothetical protein
VDVPEPPRGFDTGAICAISMDDPRAQRDLQPRAPRLEPEDKALAASDRQQRRVQFVQGFASLGIGRKHVLHFWSREVCVIVSGSAGDDAMRQANPSKNPRGTVGAPQRRCRAGTDDRNGQGERRSGSDDQWHGNTPAQPQGAASQRSTDRPHDRVTSHKSDGHHMYPSDLHRPDPGADTLERYALQNAHRRVKSGAEQAVPGCARG